MSQTKEINNRAMRSSPRTTVSFATLGCKTNQFETASMQEVLVKAGYQVVPFEDAADLVIVNTCTVTNATDAQSRNLIRRARRLNNECRVIVTGCYAQIDPDTLQSIPGVSLVIGNEEKQRLLEYLQDGVEKKRVAVSNIREAEVVCMPPLTSFSGRSRAYVQIQNGCDAFCSYCIIPYARGASRSAKPDEIVEQIKTLVASGYEEVVLTGIHIGGYGADLLPVISLNDLIKRIDNETDVHRLRLGSIEPAELTDELLETIASSSIVCRHLHIPLQSGDDEVLKRMERTYDTDFFSHRIHKVRSLFPDAAICLDVITGFPGETEEEGDNTYRFISSLPITDLHVFPYSKRPGTPAADMKSQVAGDISKARAERLRSLADDKKRAFAEQFIGDDLEVIVEQSTKDGLLKGISRNYLDVRIYGSPDYTGRTLQVKVLRWQDGSLFSEIL